MYSQKRPTSKAYLRQEAVSARRCCESRCNTCRACITGTEVASSIKASLAAAKIRSRAAAEGSAPTANQKGERGIL